MTTSTTIHDVLEDNKVLTGVIDQLSSRNDVLSEYVYYLKQEILALKCDNLRLRGKDIIINEDSLVKRAFRQELLNDFDTMLSDICPEESE